MPITDYEFLRDLIDTFSFSGSLAHWCKKETLPCNRKVTFSVSHDTWGALQSSGKHGVHMVFSTEADSTLAAQFLIARLHTIPLILGQDAKKPEIQTALNFRKEMSLRTAESEILHDVSTFSPDCPQQTLLFLERGQEGFLVLNKGGDAVVSEAWQLPIFSQLHGRYQTIGGSKTLEVTTLSQQKTLLQTEGRVTIPPRSAEFYCRLNLP
jgi:hypothetical protein